MMMGVFRRNMKVSCVHHRWVFFFPFYYYIFFFIFRQQQMKNCPIGKYIIYSEHMPVALFKKDILVRSSPFWFCVSAWCITLLPHSFYYFYFIFLLLFFFFFTSILSQRSYNGPKTTTHIKKEPFTILFLFCFLTLMEE